MKSLVQENAEFVQFINNLNQSKFDMADTSVVIGSIVMNCNPFTLGHYHLINIASQIVDYLYVFIVEEERSVFPFKDRIELVQKGTAAIKNVRILPSGKYIISSITFPEYFDKDVQQNLVVDSSMDLHIFGKHIAPTLGITVRFMGEEPNDMITKQYNENMKKVLPGYGIKCIEIPRAKCDSKSISASIVRKHIISGNFDDIEEMVPATTLEYLRNNKHIFGC